MSLRTVTSRQAFAAAREALWDFDPADAELASRAVVAGQASGWPEFGLGLLVRELHAHPGPEVGTALPSAHAARGREAPQTDVLSGGHAVGSVDATDLPGPVALARATRLAGRLARRHGIGAVGVRHAGGTGRVGAYVRSLADEGLVGLAFAHSGPRVAPLGGVAPVVGTNPVAVAVPRPGGALVLDVATSAITLAERARLERDGSPLPRGAAVDADGRATLDPTAAAALQPDGLLGSLLGLTVEVLAGLLTGARGDADGRGLLVLALDPAAFGSDDLSDRADRLADEWVLAGGHVPGSRPDPESFEVTDDVWDALVALATTEEVRP